MEPTIGDYFTKAAGVISRLDAKAVQSLADMVYEAWQNGRQVFVCGNGGSAANAEHFVNDLVFGSSPMRGDGVRATALSANGAVITCLANDIGYERIYSYQLSVMGHAGDVLIILSGSGNSPNVLAALTEAKARGIKTGAIVGYSGGKAKGMADVAVHIPVDDMQISEDCMQLVGHALTRNIAGRYMAKVKAAS
jgi:D-sedoheptulose 7-phosphate isomerase